MNFKINVYNLFVKLVLCISLLIYFKIYYYINYFNKFYLRLKFILKNKVTLFILYPANIV